MSKLRISDKTECFAYALRRECAGFVMDRASLRRMMHRCLGVETKQSFYHKIDALEEVHQALTIEGTDQYRILPIRPESSHDIP